MEEKRLDLFVKLKSTEADMAANHGNLLLEDDRFRRVFRIVQTLVQTMEKEFPSIKH